MKFPELQAINSRFKTHCLYRPLGFKKPLTMNLYKGLDRNSKELRPQPVDKNFLCKVGAANPLLYRLQLAETLWFRLGKRREIMVKVPHHNTWVNLWSRQTPYSVLRAQADSPMLVMSSPGRRSLCRKQYLKTNSWFVGARWVFHDCLIAVQVNHGLRI